MPFTSFCELSGDDHLTFVPALVLIYYPSLEVLEDVPLHVRRNMWFQHDGAPPHFTRAVRGHILIDDLGKHG